MRVIPPIAITDAMLISSSAAEPGAGETAWSSVATYAVGDTVSVIGSNSHHVYQSLQSGNLNNAPATSPLWWYDLGPTNRWKMFDLLRNTKTAAPSPLTIVVAPGKRVSSLALIGMVADSVTISATSGGVEVYSYTQNLSTRNVFDWYTYFFESFGNIPNLALFNIPPYSDIIISVALSSSSGSVECGGCVVGNGEFIGSAEYNAESDALNFSSVTRDSFGNATLVPRRTIPKTSQTLWLKKHSVNRALSVREALNAVPAVWSGLDDESDGYFDALFVLGVYRKFAIKAKGPTHALINLELEEI